MNVDIHPRRHSCVRVAFVGGLSGYKYYGLARWIGLGVTGVWWGRALSNLLNGFLFALWFRRGHWKHRQV